MTGIPNATVGRAGMLVEHVGQSNFKACILKTKTDTTNTCMQRTESKNLGGNDSHYLSIIDNSTLTIPS